MSLNKAMLIGNLGGDPELRYTQGGQAVASFSIATNEKWTDKSGNPQERTEWHKITVWGRNAENCGKYLSKGRQVYIEGQIQTNEWKDKEGNKRYTTEINAKVVQFLSGGTDDSRGRQNQNQNQEPTSNPYRKQPTNPAPSSSTFADDDIPF